MNEYVCKDVLRQVLEERFFKYIADEIIEDLPTADVQEVKHAHWIPKKLGDCECSNCHEEYGVCGGLLGDYNYCPNCGAKMDKEDEK